VQQRGSQLILRTENWQLKTEIFPAFASTTIVSMPRAANPKPLPNHCFGCGKDNPDSMRLKFTYHQEQQRFVSRFRLGKRYTGPPGYCHGGIIATILDEAMAKLNKPNQVIAVTSQMTVNYLKPVPLHRPLRVESQETEVHGRRRIRTAAILDEADHVLAQASGVFITLNPEQMLRKSV
jgi:uncharacterized domain 1